MDLILQLFGKLAPLPDRKDSNVASIVGFVFGGIGLAIYFKSFVDLLFPVMIAILATVTLGELGWFAGAVIAGMYGYYRVVESNQRLDTAAAVVPPVGAPVANP